MSYLKDTWKTWLRWLAVVLVFSIACGFLSNWQFHRREEKLVTINHVIENFATPAAPIAKLLPERSSWWTELEWRAATAVGHFDATNAILIRNRPNTGTPGFEQVVPFVTDEGNVILVSRGWLPTGNLQDSPDENPLPSSEDRTLTLRLRPSEKHVDREAPKGQSPNIEVPRILGDLKIENGYTAAYARVESDSSGDKPLRALEAPATTEGNNLSYAFQWIAFALMALGALVWMFRTERDRYLGRVKVRTRKKPTDEEIEDSVNSKK